MDGGIGQEKGRNQASGRRRGVVSPQRTDGSRRPDEGWYSRRYSPLLPGGRLTQQHRGTKGEHTSAQRRGVPRRTGRAVPRSTSTTTAAEARA